VCGFRAKRTDREGEESGGGELERPRLGVSHRMRAWRRGGARETIPTVSFLPLAPFADDHEIPSPEFPGAVDIPQRRKEDCEFGNTELVPFFIQSLSLFLLRPRLERQPCAGTINNSDRASVFSVTLHYIRFLTF